MDTTAPRKRLVHFGRFEADLEKRLLTKSGSRVRLQDQPFQVLALLLEHPGETLNRKEIRQSIWASDTYIEFDDGLNTAVKKLRRALGDAAHNPLYIETVSRRGYRFVAPISRDDDESPEPGRLTDARLTAQEIGPVREPRVSPPMGAIPTLFLWLAAGARLRRVGR